MSRNAAARCSTVERNGVTIEQCRKCHGIFLDRGEFEQLLTRESSFLGNGESSRRRRRTARGGDVGGADRVPRRRRRARPALLARTARGRPAPSAARAKGAGWVAESDGVRVGVHERGRGPGDTASLPYFPVADITSALRKVEDLGGTIVHPGERWAICRDSEGTPVRPRAALAGRRFARSSVRSSRRRPASMKSRSPIVVPAGRALKWPRRRRVDEDARGGEQIRRSPGRRCIPGAHAVFDPVARSRRPGARASRSPRSPRSPAVRRAR